MSEIIITVTRKGQVTIPATIREALGIEIGDKVSFSLQESEEGVIVVRPVRSVAEMTYGMAAASSPMANAQAVKSSHELREEFETAVAEDVMESFDRKR